MPHCLIIGGGVIGLMTARELAQAGLKVTLLERGKTGREASWAAGGILSPLFPWRYPEAVNELAQWSQRQYPTLAGELHGATGIDPEYIRSGLLLLDEAERAAALAWSNRQSATADSLNAEELLKIEPALAWSGGSAVLLPEVAQIRNPRLLQALRHSLLQLGVTLREDTEATHIVTDGQRAAGVETAQRRYAADTVILAGGAWSETLLTGLELGMAVTPVRGQMLLLRAPAGLVRHILATRQHYIIPRRDGRVLVGSTLEDVGFDKSVTQDARDRLLAFATGLVPALQDCSIEQHWAGLRPGSPEGIPYIGAHPRIAGLYISTGHHRNGIVTAPASARLLADILLNRQLIVNPSPYRPPAR